VVHEHQFEKLPLTLWARNAQNHCNNAPWIPIGSNLNKGCSWGTESIAFEKVNKCTVRWWLKVSAQSSTTDNKGDTVDHFGNQTKNGAIQAKSKVCDK